MDYLLTDYKSLEYQNCKYSGHHQDSIKKTMGPPEAYFFSYYLSRSQLGKLISKGAFVSLCTYKGFPPYTDFGTPKKNVLRKIHIRGTVEDPLLMQKSPTCAYISQKTR